MRTIWIVLGIWAITGTPAVSAEPGPGCAPVLKAMAKTLQTDHSAVTHVTVANYRTHTEGRDAVVDSTVSIAKSTGLALKVENEMDTGGGAKARYITRYSYTGIKAPAVQK